MEYDALALGLKGVLEANPSAFSSDALEAITETELRAWLAPHDVPLMVRVSNVLAHSTCLSISCVAIQAERVQKLREVGRVLRVKFGGLAANLVRAAEGSAAALVNLVVESFPGVFIQLDYIC